jgi:hypothetical protein
MELLCLLLRHRPMLNSILVREERFKALCDRCGAPIERDRHSHWVHSAALISSRKQAA